VNSQNEIEAVLVDATNLGKRAKELARKAKATEDAKNCAKTRENANAK
jgi:hypothetical protein